MKRRNIVSQLVLGVLFIAGTMVPQAQANSIWTYEGSGSGHTVTAFLELDILPPVVVPTPFLFGNVLDSGFTITPLGGASPSLSFAFDHSVFIPPLDLLTPLGTVTPPDNLGCALDFADGCLWASIVGDDILGATIFSGNIWEVNVFGPVNEFVLSGTGDWSPPVVDPNPNPNPVPEPSTMLLLGSGLVGLVGWQMRKKKV